MAFNKAKAMESALKALNQGKVAQAIQEYQAILRSDPKDQVVLMTVGDLFARQSNLPQAVEYFERLAQLYLTDGFNSKAIAIYKKISKLAPNETQPLEKLANLYVQQGILSEARPIFLQLAEAHLKANQTPKAVEVLRRLLEVEPDNPRVQRRLADLYMAMGQKKEAAQTYVQFARYLHEHGDVAEAQKMTDAAIAAEPANSGALLLKARILGAGGKADAALEALAKLPLPERNSETLALEIDLCLKAGKSSRAVELVQTSDLKGPEKFALISKVVGSLLDANETEPALSLVNEIRAPALAAGNQEFLAKLLVSTAERLKERVEPQEWLVELYRRTADNNLSEAESQLTDKLIAAGQKQRAETILNELLEREPDNELARHRLAQLKKELGAPSETPAVLDETMFQQPARELAPSAVAAEEENDLGLDEETQQFVSQALTDVDLFSSYGLSQKAVQLLETILQRVPYHAPTLERLLDLTLGTGDDRRTAELAAQLEQVYASRGDAVNAERYTELRRRFQRASGASEAEIAAGPAPLPPSVKKPAATLETQAPATAPPEFSIPLSETVPTEASEPKSVAPAREPEPLKEPEPPKEPEIDLSDEWESLASETSVPPPAEAPASVAAPVETETEMPDFDLELVAESGSSGEASTTEGLLDQLVAEVEGMGATPDEPASPVPPVAPQVTPPSPPRKEPVKQKPASVPSVHPAAANDNARATAGGNNELNEIFQEFRAELGEMGEQEKDEDLETHYNLGIAYREMGLLDEAIGEFQKVAKAVHQGRPFRYAMQCCTLLGLTFADKNEPKIAALWYQRALQLPGLEQETVIALRYDLGVAEEQAGNVDAALDSFRQVYAMNIDYRDVSERISALQKH